jgi:hypothetical protein
VRIGIYSILPLSCMGRALKCMEEASSRDSKIRRLLKPLSTGIANIAIFDKIGWKPVHNSILTVETLINRLIFSINQPIWPINLSYHKTEMKQRSQISLASNVPNQMMWRSQISSALMEPLAYWPTLTDLLAVVLPNEEHELDRRQARRTKQWQQLHRLNSTHRAINSINRLLGTINRRGQVGYQDRAPPCGNHYWEHGRW